MSRKFLQMGYTRSRRYANHKGGRKYVYEDGQAKGKGKVRKVVKKVDGKKVMVENDEGWRDEGKEESASIFKEVLEKAKNVSGVKSLERGALNRGVNASLSDIFSCTSRTNSILI